MNVIPLQVFVSLVLVGLAVLLLVYSVRQGDHDHADRLSLLPLEGDGRRDEPAAAAPAPAVNAPPPGARS